MRARVRVLATLVSAAKLSYSSFCHRSNGRYLATLTTLRVGPKPRKGNYASRHCRGEADAEAIDSNVLRIELRSSPELEEQFQVLDYWGPFPIQPVVLRSGLHQELKDRLRTALITIDANQHTSPPSSSST